MAHAVQISDTHAVRPLRCGLAAAGVVFLAAVLGTALWVIAVPLGMIPLQHSVALPPGAVPDGARWLSSAEDGPGEPAFDALGVGGLPAADDWLEVVCDPRLRELVLEPGQLAVDSERDVSANCDRVLSLFFAEEFVGSVGGWRCGKTERVYWGDGLHPTQAVALAEFGGRIGSPDGGETGFRGRVGVSESCVLLVGKVEDAAPVPNLELVVPQALIVWPPGLEALGRMEHSHSGAGHLWKHRRWDGDSVLGRDIGFLWPTNLSCWSDGRWFALGIFIDGKPDMSSAAVTPPPAFITHADREPRCLPDDLGRYDLRPAASADAAALAPTVNDRPAAGRDLRLRFVSAAQWTGGAVTPVPDEVARRLGLAPGTESLMIDLRSDPVLGDAKVGLLDCVDRRRSLQKPMQGPCQWVLARDYFAVTLVSQISLAMDGGRSSEPPGEWLWHQLPMLLGGDGLRLTAVPVHKRRTFSGRGLLAWPAPDTLVGFPEQYRVGEQPWGRCRIYVDPAILHIVFDLPEEEGGAE